MNDEIINAACCVFPDGTVFWLYEPTQDLISRTFELWRESLEDPILYARCSSGVVTVRMPRSKFNAITAHYPDPIAQGLPAYDAPPAPATDTGMDALRKKAAKYARWFRPAKRRSGFNAPSHDWCAPLAPEHPSRGAKRP